MLALRRWIRVSKVNPCAICNHSDWCLRSGDGSVAICPRRESPERIGDAGWLHWLIERKADDRSAARRTVRLRVAHGVDGVDGADPRDASAPDWSELAQQCAAATDDARLQRLATALGLSTHSLRRLGTGWSAAHQAWSFPMADATGAVLGIRLRRPSGRKLTIAGGHEGLFIPSGLNTSGQLVIAEGPTDCAALLDWGFAAIGRPSCAGGRGLLVEAVRKWRPASVVILSDSDEAGLRGARSLLSALSIYHRNIRMITPPDGIKDARAWRHAGGTRDDIEKAIASAAPHAIQLVSKRRGVARGR